MDSALRAGAATLFCVGLAHGVSCKSTIANTDHCYYNLGNETCADRYDDLPYCATTCAGKDGNAPSPNDDGCVAWEPAVGCYSPCGGENDVADDASCLGVADSGSTSMTTTTTSATDEPTTGASTTTPVACTSSADCSDDAPICVDDECRPCGDAALPDGECELRDPATPTCSDAGACVQCTSDNASACGGTTPVCDASGVCVACTDHDQCEDACELATGACFPDDCVREVPGDYATIQDALDAVAEEPFCVIRVTNDVNGSIVLEATPPRALVYAGVASTFSLRGTAGSRTLQALEGATLYIEGLRFDLNPIGAVDAATTSQLYLDDVEVVGNPGDGVRVLTGAHMQMRNTIVAGNGDGTADTPGVQIYQATADILYSTIVDNDGSEVDTLQCQNSAVTVRNSILMATAGQSISCDEDITFSAVDENVGGTGNMDLSPLDLAWFSSAPALDYRLTEAGVDTFDGIARWRDGDPLQDLDGEARVAMDGASEPAGADVPSPK